MIFQHFWKCPKHINNNYCYCTELLEYYDYYYYPFVLLFFLFFFVLYYANLTAFNVIHKHNTKTKCPYSIQSIALCSFNTQTELHNVWHGYHLDCMRLRKLHQTCQCIDDDDAIFGLTERNYGFFFDFDVKDRKRNGKKSERTLVLARIRPFN